MISFFCLYLRGMQIKQPKRVYIGVHILFWVFIALVPYFLIPDNPNRFTTETIFNWIKGLLLSAGIFYLFYGYVIRRFLKPDSIIRFFLISLVFFFSYCGVQIAIDYLSYTFIFKHTEYNFPSKIFTRIFANTFIVGIALLVLLIENWFLTQKYHQEVEREKLESELKMLRFQVNPHFLFNTLNNIYTLVYKKSDEAPEAVLKLSALMRYMLYETDGNSVSLAKEIDYLRNFVELQQLRLVSSQKVTFKVEGDADGYMIAPLLLVPFIENAFKYGIRASKETLIEISVLIKDGVLTFSCINDYRSDITSEVDSGIGLVNVKKRLELIYNGRYKLDFDTRADKYCVNLVISL